MNINKGENISIVGYNGSGKSTLVNCILGLYDVNEGVINVNGNNIVDIDRMKYFEKVSAIFQDFNKYKYTVRENVGFGDINKLEDSQELYRMIQKVGLSEKVENLQHNLDTYLTKEMPEGSELSGGEWQRLAIARGFLRDADLIILLVAAAGNNGYAKKGTITYPAAYNSVIAVGAVDQNNTRASFSSVGKQLELMAPGVDILSTVPNNGYASYNGTSMASPHVAGVATLVWEANPNLTNVQLRNLLNETATYLGDSFEYGNGLV